uniref:Uncharacterized protein n=1 Tax=Paramormyrops kingsleyae TaxID=1676925 RepID=A0A3B3R6L7_9TELE
MPIFLQKKVKPQVNFTYPLIFSTARNGPVTDHAGCLNTSFISQYIVSVGDGKCPESCLENHVTKAMKEQEILRPHQPGDHCTLLSEPHQHYFCCATDYLSCCAQSVGESELWSVHLALYPEANFLSISCKHYAHQWVPEDEVSVDTDIHWAGMLQTAVLGQNFDPGNWLVRTVKGGTPHPRWTSHSGRCAKPGKWSYWPATTYMSPSNKVTIILKSTMGVPESLRSDDIITFFNGTITKIRQTIQSFMQLPDFYYSYSY